ncbi:unnamed protein product, partial [marine sediment metagenome]
NGEIKLQMIATAIRDNRTINTVVTTSLIPFLLFINRLNSITI